MSGLIMKDDKRYWTEQVRDEKEVKAQESKKNGQGQQRLCTKATGLQGLIFFYSRSGISSCLESISLHTFRIIG